ncbi:hypothetical protein [Herpetosiphon sp. NSE202]|uniref:hypothetical protein n=1 Tax=Herpetosiphon sp. NSE202 TaxID=3351349 RepID=UPI003632F8F9
MGLLASLFGCGSSAVPEAVRSGLDEQSIQTIGTLDISPWLGDNPRYQRLSLIQAQTQAGQPTTVAYLEPHAGAAVFSLPLSRQFPDAPLQTALFEIDGYRLIVGLVDAEINGELTTIEFEREEPNQANWLEALKVSNLNQRSFVIPIAPNEQAQWSTIQRIAVNTRESRQRGVDDRNASGHAWEQQYSNPIAIDSTFAVVP